MNLPVIAEEWKTYATIIAAITTMGGFLFAGWRYVRAKVTPFRSWWNRLNSAILELSPNGGFSIRDRIGRIDSTIQMNAARVAILMEREELPIYECNKEGACTFANRALCELFNLDREEMMGEGWLRAVLPQDREPTYDLWKSATQKQIPYEANYSIRRDREIIPVVTRAEPMFGHDNEVIGYQGYVMRVENSS